MDPTAFNALHAAIRCLFETSDREDSWGPMLRALAVLNGPDANQLYEKLFFADRVRFQYPPTSLLFLNGAAALGISGVTALNRLNLALHLVNAAGVGALAWAVFRRTPAAKVSRPGMVAIAACAALIFFPVTRALALGQIQVWIDLLFTGSMLAWVLGQRLVAGCLIGIACAIKPQFALLLLWALLWREWGFAIGFAAGLAPIGVASLLAFGIAPHIGYLRVLSFLSENGESLFANNSVNGILGGYFVEGSNLHWNAHALTPYVPAVHAGTLAASVLALAAIVLPPLFRRGERADTACFAAAAICTVIGSPVAWEHHYGVLLPIYPVVLAACLAEPGGAARRLRLAGLTVSWVLVATFIPFVALLATTPWRGLEAHFFIGGVMLAGLLVLPRGQERTAGNRRPDEPRMREGAGPIGNAA